METQNLDQWFHQFFKQRNLQQADGRNLYEYTPTHQEFQELKTLLTKAYVPNASIQSSLFWQGYVLFGAFCFAYLYKEGVWTWKEINAELGTSDLLAQDRGNGIYVGAKQWGLESKISLQGKKYIGFVLSQAGVPITALKRQNSWLATLVVSAIRFYREWRCSESKVQAYLSRYQDRIPESFQLDDALYIVTKTALLIDQALENNASTHLQSLAKQFPSFDINNDDLEELLQQYKKASRSTASQQLLHACRYIVFNQSVPVLVQEIRLQKNKAKLSELAVELKIDPGFLQSARGFYLDNEPFAVITQQSKDDYVLSPVGNAIHKKLKRTNQKALKGVFARVVGKQGTTTETATATAAIAGASELNQNEPITFKLVKDGNDERWNHYATGSCSLPTTEALVLIPPTVKGFVDGEVISSDFLGFQLVKITSSIHLVDDDAEYDIRLNEMSEVVFEEFYAKGERLEYQLENMPIFKGTPTIFSRRERKEDGGFIESEWDVEWYNARKERVFDPASHGFGVYTAKVRKDNKVIKTLRYAMVPPEASIFYKCANRNHLGSIVFNKWQLSDCQCDVAREVSVNPSFVGLIFENVSADQIRPVTMTLFAPNGQKPMRMTMPYPQKYCSFMLGNQQIDELATISLADAFNFSVDIVAQEVPEEDEYKLKIEPVVNRHSKGINVEINYDIPIKIFNKGQLTQLFFNDIKAPLYRSLKLCRNIKADLSLVLSLKERRHQTLFLKRYSRSIHAERDAGDLFIEIHNSSIRTNLPSAFNALAPKYKLKAYPLWKTDIPAVDLGEYTENSRQKIHLEPNQDKGWLIAVEGDKRFQTLPTVVQPLCNDDPLITCLLQNDTLELSCGRDGAVDELLFGAKQSKEAWGYLLELLSKLQPRGMAFIPLWKKLKFNKSLALAITFVLDVLYGQSNSRSLTLSVARTNAWRWDFLSQAELTQTMKLVFDYLNHSNQALIKSILLERLCDFFEWDVCTEFPSLGSRLAYALLTLPTGIAIPGKLLNTLYLKLKPTPLNGTSFSEYKDLRKIKESFNTSSALGVRPQEFFLWLDSKFMDAARQSYFDTLNKDYPKVGRWLHNVIEEDFCRGEYKMQSRTMFIPILIAVVMELMGKNIEQPSNEHEALLLFEAETIMGEFPQWANWCQEFAVALVEHMKQNSMIGVENE